MAKEIIQTLGFDAGNAISTLNNLNKSLATFSTQLNNVAQAAKGFNKSNLAKSLKAIRAAKPAQSLKEAGVAAGTLGQKITQAGNQGGQALKNLNNQSKSLSISWQTLSRIIVAQTIVRGFNAITGSIRSAITETRELQKRIGEIQTIAGGSLGGAEGIAAGLQVTAETFGFDILDVAEAKYQELSNQVDGSTESLEFQDSAAKLARITNTKLTDSVSALSSVLNAFGKNAENSEAAAGLLFKTVEQGRIRLPELASALGRVAPTANALGIEFNEVGASIARITQGGVRADTAITQFGGILNKLLKPTDALKEAFNKLGVSSALEGIQQSGGSVLIFLKKLQEVAGDDVSLAKFFNNIRAIQGILSLIGTDAQKTSDVFAALGIEGEQAGAILREQFNVATANDAVEYEKLIQKLSGTFRELATAVIPLINKALEFFIDTIDAIRSNPLLTGSLLATAAGLFTGLGGAATIASGGVGTLTAAIGAAALAFGPAVLVFGAIAVGITSIALAFKEAKIEAFAPLVERFTKRLDEMNEAVSASKSALQAQAQGFKESSREAAAFGEQFIELRKQAQEAVRALNSEFVDSSSSALNSLLKTRQSITKSIQNAIEKADSAAIKSSEKVASIQLKKDDFLLQRRLSNLSDLNKAFKLFQVSQDQAGSANALIKGSTDLTEFDAAADVLDRRLKLAQQGLSAAKASGNVGAIARAEQQVVTALNDQINLEKQRGALIQKRKLAAEEAAAADKAQTQQLKTLIGDIQKEISIINTGGGLLNATELAASEQKVTDLIGKLSEFSLTGDQLDLSDILGIQELSSRFQKDLADTQRTISDRRGSIVGEVEKIFTDLNALVDDNVIEVAIKLNLTEGGPDQIKSLIEAFASGSKEIDNLTGSQARFEAAQLRVTANQKAFQDLFKDTSGPDGFAESVNRSAKTLSENVNVTEADVKKFISSLKAVTGTDIFNQIDLGGDAGDKEVIDSIFSTYQGILKTRQALEKIEVSTQGDRDRLELLKEFQEAASANIAKIQTIIDVMGSADAKTGNLTEKTLAIVNTVASVNDNWLSVNGSLAVTATNQDRVAEAAKRAEVASLRAAAAAAKAAVAGGAVGNKMFGGPLYRAAGGITRGTDTIPTMLSPGEFVVNASSSRKFASQLNAINSGSNPVFRQEGGPITNNTVNVGDINVNGTADPDDTARRVLSKIRREFRRGTASRF